MASILCSMDDPTPTFPSQGKGSKGKTSFGKTQEALCLSALKAESNHTTTASTREARKMYSILNGLVIIKIPLPWMRRTWGIN